MKALSNFHVPTYASVQVDITTSKNIQVAPSEEESCMRRKPIPHDYFLLIPLSDFMLVLSIFQ